MYDRGKPWERLHKEPYPRFVAWGKSKEAGNIYITPTIKFQKDLKDN